MNRFALSIAVLGAILGASALAAQPNKRPSDEVRGKELYSRHCEACHGAYARGHGPATQALVHPVPDLLGKVKADEATMRVVLRGKAAMPGYEQTFDKQDAKRVLQHMARIKAPSNQAPPPAEAEPPPAEDVDAAEPGEEDAQPPQADG